MSDEHLHICIQGNKEEMKNYHGVVSFPLIYEVDKEELEEFEKNFPFKEKEVRETHFR